MADEFKPLDRIQSKKRLTYSVGVKQTRVVNLGDKGVVNQVFQGNATNPDTVKVVWDLDPKRIDHKVTVNDIEHVTYDTEEGS